MSSVIALTSLVPAMPSGLCSIQYPACWEHACHLPPTSEVLEFLPEEQTQPCVLQAEQLRN